MPTENSVNDKRATGTSELKRSDTGCDPCSHPATAHYTRCAVEGCPCSTPSFRHVSRAEADATRQDAAPALFAALKWLRDETHAGMDIPCGCRACIALASGAGEARDA